MHRFNSKIICHDCEGLGVITCICTNCNGSGESSADGTICKDCKGEGELEEVCHTCQGLGEITIKEGEN